MIIVDYLFLLLFFAGITFIIGCLSIKNCRLFVRDFPYLIPVVTLIVGMVFGYAYAVGLNYEKYLWSMMFYFSILFLLGIGSLMYLAVFSDKFRKRYFWRNFLLANFVLGLLFIYSMFVPTFVNNIINSIAVFFVIKNSYIISIIYIKSLLIVSCVVSIIFSGLRFIYQNIIHRT